MQLELQLHVVRWELRSVGYAAGGATARRGLAVEGRELES